MSWPAGCIRYQGMVYRGHNPQWAFAPESGEGARNNGGRWNPIDTPALYTSCRFETAWLEAQQSFPYKTQPLTLCTYEVDCAPILDLTDATNLQRYAINDEELKCAWLEQYFAGVEPDTWRIAKDLMDRGIAGIMVHSQAVRATADDINVVFWQWSHHKPHRVTVIDDEQRL